MQSRRNFFMHLQPVYQHVFCIPLESSSSSSTSSSLSMISCTNSDSYTDSELQSLTWIWMYLTSYYSYIHAQLHAEKCLTTWPSPCWLFPAHEYNTNHTHNLRNKKGLNYMSHMYMYLYPNTLIDMYLHGGRKNEYLPSVFTTLSLTITVSLQVTAPTVCLHWRSIEGLGIN